MTVIDRAHRLVLILLVVAIPAIFLVDFIAEAIRGEITNSPGWQVYLTLEILAIYQIKTRRYEADWIIIVGGIGTAAMGLLSHFGTATAIDLTATVALIPIIGLVAVVVSRRAPVITGGLLGLTAIALTAIALSEDGLRPDDIITKTAAVALLFGLAAWLLHRLRRAYETQFEERERFIAAVSHELRSPLTALNGFTEALSTQIVDPGSAEASEIIELMAAQAQEAADIVEDLLVASRVDAGEVTTGLVETDLAAEISTVTTAMHPTQTTLKSVAIEAEPVAVIADPLRLRQIIRNLVTNAIRHGGDSIVVTTAVRDGQGILEVADNGTNFDVAEIGDMFAPYGRSKHTDRSSGSIGLGLTVSRQLAHLMHGSLEADRKDGVTVFRLRLPLADSPARVSA